METLFNIINSLVTISMMVFNYYCHISSNFLHYMEIKVKISNIYYDIIMDIHDIIS